MSNDPSKKNINENHIILLFVNFDYPPEIITEKINLSPSKTGLKGERYYLGHNQEVVKYRKSNFWEYELRQITNDFIGESFDQFVEEIIYPRAASIRSIAETCNGEIKMVQYYYNGYNPGYHLPAKIIAMLSGTKLDIDIDTYCLTSE